MKTFILALILNGDVTITEIKGYLQCYQALSIAKDYGFQGECYPKNEEKT